MMVEVWTAQAHRHDDEVMGGVARKLEVGYPLQDDHFLGEDQRC